MYIVCVQNTTILDSAKPIQCIPSLLKSFSFWFNPLRVPHRLESTDMTNVIINSLYGMNNHHLTSQFCGDELNPKFKL